MADRQSKTGALIVNVFENDREKMTEFNPTVYDAFPTMREMHNVNRANFADIVSDGFWNYFEKFKPITCLSVERLYNIYTAVSYIENNQIAGDFVECGVFLGGSLILAENVSAEFGSDNEKRFYAFDTFCGFSDGKTEKDIFGNDFDLTSIPLMQRSFRTDFEQNVKISCRFPNRVEAVEGNVDETLFGSKLPEEIAYLRLDTDCYESTKAELEVLYPRLTGGGVLIIDDYGHFLGVREAVDEYLAKQPTNLLLQRIDYTGRCAIKTP